MSGLLGTSGKQRLAELDAVAADLDPAPLGPADLDRADLDRADLDRADLDRADLDRADLDLALLDAAGLCAPERSVPDLDVARHRLARAFAAEGRQWPALAAAVLVTRGRLRLSVTGFARVLGIPVSTAIELERGGCAPLLAPAALASLAPEIEWPALGVPLGRWPPPPGPAARHPASHRPGRLPA